MLRYGDTLKNTRNKTEEQIKNYDKQISRYSKQIISSDKQIERNKKAITKLGYRTPEENREQEQSKNEEGNIETETQIIEDEEEKSSVWQLLKKIGNNIKQWWNKKTKTPALPDPEAKTTNIGKNKFAQSLKYQVVRDITKEMKLEKLREIKQEEKREKNQKEIEK